MFAFKILIGSICALMAESALVCSSGKEICFTSTVSGADMIFDIETKVKGWVGIGFGSKMANSYMMLAYTINGKGTGSSRYATGQNLPATTTKQTLTLVSSSSTSEGYKYQISRPISQSSSITLKNAEQDLIFAWSTATLTSDTIAKHTDYGSAKVNLFTGETASLTGVSDPMSYKITHAVFMFVSWAVLIPAAIYIARFLKGTLGKWWFRTHAILGFLTAALTVIAFALILQVASEPFESPHGIIGLMVFILMFAQIILGVVIDRMFNPARAGIPIRDKMHWWLGRITWVLALVGMALGTQYFDAKVALLVTLLIYIAIFVAFLAFSEIRYGQSHHHTSLGGGHQHASDVQLNEQTNSNKK